MENNSQDIPVKNEYFTGNEEKSVEVNDITSGKCQNCGAEIRMGARFCSNCGAEQHIDELLREKQNKRKPGALIVGIVLGVIALVGAIVTAIILKGTPVTDIQLLVEEVTMNINETKSIVYTITPSDATNKQVKWSTSNEAIATVDSNGKITAKQAGICSITITSNNGKTDTMTVIVKEAIQTFNELFKSYASKDWCEIASDGSWMSIDTNPNNHDSDSTSFALWYLTNGSDCLDAIETINEKLGFSAVVYKRMEETTALQGRQFEENENYKVSWTYHPDHGLEITYEVKGY